MTINNLTWSWVEMCGPSGLVVWSPTKHDIGACFQQLFLQIPVLAIFAIVSAYYYGVRSRLRSCRSHRKWVIRCRMCFSSLIAITPIVRVIIGYSNTNIIFRPVDYLTEGVGVLSWCVHIGYVHTLRHRPNVHGPVLVRVLWTLTAMFSVLNLRSILLLEKDSQDTIMLGFAIALVVLQVLYGLTFFTFLCGSSQEQSTGHLTETSSLLGSSMQYHEFREAMDWEYLGYGLNWGNVPSWLLFAWVNPLILKGENKKIRNCDDLYDLPNGWDSSSLQRNLHNALYGNENPQATIPRHSLLRGLHKCFAFSFYSLGLLKILSDLSNFAGPLLLNRLVTFVESSDSSTSSDHVSGYILVLMMFGSTLVGAFCNSMFTFLMSLVGLRMRGALIALVYRKTLHISYDQIHSFSIGEIMNFMNTDVDRIVNSCPSFHMLWSIPFQIAVSFFLLYQQVGISFAAGVVFTIVLIPINRWVAVKIGSLSSEMMRFKDSRVSFTAEMLKGIRVLKLNVWENYFFDSLLGLRDIELKYLKYRKYLDAFCVYAWAATPVIVAVLTLTMYSLLGNHLTAAKVFTTLALLNMLIGPLNTFPWVLNGLVEAWVSLKRLQRLLDVPDLELRDYYYPNADPLKMSHCSSYWEGQSDVVGCATTAGLLDVSVSIEPNSLVGVIGTVGCGKTVFLMTLLGEVNKTNGTVSVLNWEGGFGLVAQTPWLQHGTIRSNILFGKSYESNKYKAVLDACCLTEDLAALHGGDMAQVGESGVTLSGGQKARLALARAVYQDKDIYLIDDVLSALDPPVARFVYNKVICGLLKNKTRIFCTNNTQLLANADLIIQMDEGRIIASGKPAEILQNLDDVPNDDLSMCSYKESRNEEEYDRPNDDEISETGAVKRAIYKRYASSAGISLSFSILVSLLLMQFSRNISDYWLSKWVEAGNKTESHYSTNFYLTSYIVLAILNTFATLIRAFLFAFGGIRAAQTIHKKLLKNVMYSKTTFFDIVPLGRILNRFSSDTYTVDDSLPFIVNILLAQLFGLAGSLVITTYGMPWLCLIIVPLVPIYHSLQRSYRQCSRELKRLGSVTLSPLYGNINETLQGLVTIRAFRCLFRFQKQNESLLDNYQRALFSNNAVSGWLSIRLQMMGVAIVTGVALVAVLQHQFDVAIPAFVGLTVAYSLSINGLLSGVISAFVETERELVALERVVQYTDAIEQEPESGDHPPYAWPSQGVITFQSVYLKYRDHLAPSLNGISFETRPAEKIGVVGRTGAGKSSLIVALLRLVDAFEGDITIDTVNIKKLNLTGLRSRITVIPQDPYLFNASIRRNLDPLNEYNDTEVWKALEKCHCRQLITDLGGLDFEVKSGGSNFSLGQRQLLCLVRAVLKNSRIICIDEATASVDQETDRLIQKTIRSCFRQSTVLTIAHRVATVMDSDRLLVLRDGEVVEFDTPENLVGDPNSSFYKLSENMR